MSFIWSLFSKSTPVKTKLYYIVLDGNVLDIEVTFKGSVHRQPIYVVEDLNTILLIKNDILTDSRLIYPDNDQDVFYDRRNFFVQQIKHYSEIGLLRKYQDIDFC